MNTQGFTTMRIPLIGIATLLAAGTAFTAEPTGPGPADMTTLKAEIEQLRSLPFLNPQIPQHPASPLINARP